MKLGQDHRAAGKLSDKINQGSYTKKSINETLWSKNCPLERKERAKSH
jgi:hypothetical protein